MWFLCLYPFDTSYLWLCRIKAMLNTYACTVLFKLLIFWWKINSLVLKVVIHYYGRLAAKQGWRFDSTYDHKDENGEPNPFVFILGSGKVRSSVRFCHVFFIMVLKSRCKLLISGPVFISTCRMHSQLLFWPIMLCWKSQWIILSLMHLLCLRELFR